MATQCIITGCALRLEHQRAYAWGDLHLQEKSFVFVGVYSHTQQSTVWNYDRDGDGADVAAKRKELLIPVGYDYFERRGVFVIEANAERLLNRAALEYVRRWS